MPRCGAGARLAEVSRMRVLWAKSDVLVPLDTGGKLRTWHLLRHIASRHDVTYLGCATPDQSRADIDAMHEVARTVHIVPRRHSPKGSWRFYATAALHLADPLPYAVGSYRSRAVRARIDAILREQQFDIIVCDFLVPAVNLPRRLPCPSVIFTHNVESEIWRRHAETKTGVLSRLLYGAQYRRMFRYERRALDRFEGVLAVSDADRDTFDRIYPAPGREPATVVATGVDTGYFAPATPASPERSTRLVFTGSMDWLP